MVGRFTLFFILNFGALAIGGLFTGDGVASEWYANLNQAPWTPPGWVFGTAWTLIMVCFTLFMTSAINEVENKASLITLFAIQWILNVSWNPIFFYYHEVLVGMLIISALTIVMGYFIFKYIKDFKLQVLLIAPYFIWLLIATSLNGFILLKN